MKLYNFLFIHKKKFYIALSILSGLVVCSLLTCLVFLFLLFHQFIPLLPKLPQILGFDRTKNYLILFQNNMELRPGGGFIGAYADIVINKGSLGQLHVHNTYDADGQLKQHVEPYYIGRRFIQVHLYMRDSNFDVDFVKSAQKVAQMYQLETGHHADGVVAIDFSYVQRLVGLLSPIYVWQYNETVTVNNFFYVTEFHADKHSFYGSTQKQDFLRGLFESMQIRFGIHKLKYLIAALRLTIDAIEQKHVLFASTDAGIQEILTKANVSSSLYDTRVPNATTVTDFLGINEANIGINKSNYFLTRAISHEATITASGEISEKVTLSYYNASPKEEWPIGRYIPYIRIILPKNANLFKIIIDGKQQDIVPAVTDFRIYEAPGFESPKGLEVDKSEEEGKTIYGFRTLISYHSKQIVQVYYTLAQRVNIQDPQIMYDLLVFKQPGTEDDVYNFTFIYPSSFGHVTSFQPLADKTKNNSKIVSSLLMDQHIQFILKK